MLHCWIRNTETGEIEPFSANGLILLGNGYEFVSEAEYNAYWKQQEDLAIQE